MFPAFLEIYRRTGLKPRIIVSEEYASVYDGISFVDSIPVGLNWWGGVPQARALALSLSKNAIFPQWWLEPDPMPAAYRGTFNLTCHGHSWGVNIDLWPNFMASMYSRAGFTREEMMQLPLVFVQSYRLTWALRGRPPFLPLRRAAADFLKLRDCPPRRANLTA